jgi:hypothetical protein
MPRCMNQPRRVSRAPRGGHARKGARLPALSEVLADARTVWQAVTVAGWHGSAERRLEICSGQAVWFRSGQIPLPSAADASRHIDALRASIRWAEQLKVPRA